MSDELDAILPLEARAKKIANDLCPGVYNAHIAILEHLRLVEQETATRAAARFAKIELDMDAKNEKLRAENERLLEAMLDAADDCACEKHIDAEETLRTALASTPTPRRTEAPDGSQA